MEITPGSLNYNILFTLIIIVIIFKALLSGYLFYKIIKKTKKEGKFEFDFLFSIFVLILFLCISRSILLYYDFFLTYFNPDLFWIYPNIIYWKLADLFPITGFVIMAFIMDKKALNFKLKGVVGYVIAGLEVFKMLYPVNSEEDFRFISSFGLIQSAILVIIPAGFLYIAVKSDTLRNLAIIIILGISIYALGGILIGESVLAPLRELFGENVHVSVFFVFVITKIVGLSMLAYAMTKFYV